MWRRVLLALDQFESGQAALDFAVGMSRSSGTEVRVFHVRELSRFTRVPPVETVKDAVFLVEQAVSTLRQADIRAEGCTVSTIEEFIPTRIVDEAVRWQCDAVILGSRRLRGLKRMTGRGVRDRVMRLSPLPVVVAPTPLPARTRRLRVPGSTPSGHDRVRLRRQ